jgi:hypothetical protein
MALSPAAAHHRARIAALSRDRAPDDPDLVAARRDFCAEQLATHVAEVVADTALTAEQRARIIGLLAGDGR